MTWAPLCTVSFLKGNQVVYTTKVDPGIVFDQSKGIIELAGQDGVKAGKSTEMSSADTVKIERADGKSEELITMADVIVMLQGKPTSPAP